MSTPRTLFLPAGMSATTLAATAWLEMIRVTSDLTDATIRELPTHEQKTFRLRRRFGQAKRLLGAKPERGERIEATSHDLVLLICPGPYDLYALSTVVEDIAKSHRTAAWIIEAWPSDANRALDWEPVEYLDAVFTSTRSGTTTLEQHWGHQVPIHYLPMAADVALFAERSSSSRPISVFNPGRREPTQHERLTAAAAAAGGWYLYDTTTGGAVHDPIAHRSAYAATVGRSSVMVTNYAKSDLPAVVGTNREVPARAFEAIAGGALPVGYPPSAENLEASGLPTDLVRPWPSGELSLTAWAGEADRARSDLLKLAACAHDWAHRWIQICDALAIDAGDPAHERVAELQALSRELRPG